jgi:tRNA uridine 5-carboxymethylaminomethyl modification enzyme
LKTKEEFVKIGKKYLEEKMISPTDFNSYLESSGTNPLVQKEKFAQVLRRPEAKLSEMIFHESFRDDGFIQRLYELPQKLQHEILEQIEIEIKYDGYISQQEEQIDRFEKFESILIPDDFDFKSVRSLSAEGKEKLNKVQPRSIGQASRISGVTAADVSVLMVHLRN